jgi:hypothetical protein
MKNVTLKNNTWKERVRPQLNNEEKSLLADRSESKKDEREALIVRLRDQFFADLSEEESGVAQSIYEQNKIDGATLISVDILLPDGSGIINCRVDKEHKQIRF